MLTQVLYLISKCPATPWKVVDHQDPKGLRISIGDYVLQGSRSLSCLLTFRCCYLHTAPVKGK